MPFDSLFIIVLQLGFVTFAKIHTEVKDPIVLCATTQLWPVYILPSNPHPLELSKLSCIVNLMGGSAAYVVVAV
jgi:hypothetical protein